MKRFEKTPAQQRAIELLQSPARHILLFGGSRSGKTFILIYALLVRALKAPGSRHAILRFHGNGARYAVGFDTLPKVVRLAFPDLRIEYIKSDNFFRLPNASEIWLGGLDADERADRILGREFATIYFNECSEIPYSGITTALTRLAQNTTLRNRAYYDCNPAGKSHWSYKLFVEKIEPENRLPLKHPENYACMLMNPADNQANLPPGYIEETLGSLSRRQQQRFMEGIWLDDINSGLWNYAMIDRNRLSGALPELQRIVIGVDPAVTASSASDQTGIVAAGRDEHNRFYVLADHTMHGTPLQWANAVRDLFYRFNADRVVGEVNQGGDLIAMALHNAAPELPFKAVRALRGKYLRAEPIAALYEANRVHHVGIFPELEDQMCSYQPGSQKSPDRLDALVWALTELSGGNANSRLILA
ncbi:MAG: DNA-packaging protein [Lentisphaerae bacterium]|nr:DNA-packaging protein [Lentisphaerota bacterium]